MMSPHPRKPEALPVADIAGVLAGHAGLVFPPDRHALLEGASRELMAESGISSAGVLLQQLQTDASLLDKLLSRVTIPESYFFRDPVHFDYIAQTVLPALRKLRPAGAVVSAWSAGCAGGEEAYSLAMLFEQLGYSPGQVRILASDISRRALTRARQGLYSGWSLRGKRALELPASFILPEGRSYRVDARFREQVRFFYLNLFSSSYPSPQNGVQSLDLILCRNVLIYFDGDGVRQVAQRLYQTLAPGGYLITGPSDPLLAGFAPFSTLMTQGGLVYRRPSAGPTRQPSMPGPAFASNDPAPTLARAVNHAPRPVRAASRAVRAGVRPLPVPRAGAKAAPPVTEGAMTHERAAERLDDALPDLFSAALLAMQRGQDDTALGLLRKILYLDAHLALPHFTMGLLLERQGHYAQARRSYQSTVRLTETESDDARVPLSEGEPAGVLRQAALQHLQLLQNKPVRGRHDR